MLTRLFLDQLERSAGLAGARLSAVRDELARAERLSGRPRGEALTRLATQLDGEAGAADPTKVRMLAEGLRSLAAAR